MPTRPTPERMPSDQDIITIVSGIPRSGTSLVMQMLVAAGIEPLVDAARAPDDSNPRGYFELSDVKRMPRAGTDWVAGARGRCVKVIYALLEFLPRNERYCVLFVERDLDEVIDSQDRMLERLGESVGGLPRVRLRPILESQSETARQLLEAERCFEWRRISHQELISEPTQTAEKIASFLGRSEHASSMAACVDATLYRERAERA